MCVVSLSFICVCVYVCENVFVFCVYPEQRKEETLVDFALVAFCVCVCVILFYMNMCAVD